MGIDIQLKVGDVTLTGDAPCEPSAVPSRTFSIKLSGGTYQLTLDGRKVLVPRDHIQDLYHKVQLHSSVEWKHSTEPSVRSAFAPLNRIVNAINSTPSYQLFLAGFQVAAAVGLFSDDKVDEQEVVDSLERLYGSLEWDSGKKGRLFFLPDGFVANDDVVRLLVTNGKLFRLTWVREQEESNSLGHEKFCVPYVPPLGFNTKVTADVESAWSSITKLARVAS